MADLYFRYYNETLTIVLSKELNGFHKSTLEVDEKKYKEEATKVAKEIRNIKGFKSFHLGFGEVDWYESCRTFYVPRFACTSENKRVKVEKCEYYDIPKDWEIYYSLTIENPETMRGINKYFEALRIHLKDSELNEIKKSLKSKKYLHFDIIWF